MSKGNYVLFEDKESETVKIESRKTRELVQFVAAEDIDVLNYEKPYFVIPADDLAEEAYVVLRETLKGAKKVALGQLSVRGREQPVALKPCGRGIEPKEIVGVFAPIGRCLVRWTRPRPWRRTNGR